MIFHLRVPDGDAPPADETIAKSKHAGTKWLRRMGWVGESWSAYPVGGLADQSLPNPSILPCWYPIDLIAILISYGGISNCLGVWCSYLGQLIFHHEGCVSLACFPPLRWTA